MVSNMLSPLARELECKSRFSTCAPKRRLAKSNDARVRVLGSKNRLARVTPASSRPSYAGCPGRRRYVSARSSMAVSASRVRPSSVMRWRRPPALSCCERICASCFFGEPTFQDDAGRRCVDIGFADTAPAQARCAGRLEPRLGSPRRIALIDQYDLQPIALPKIGGELASGGCHRTVGTVDIIRQADHGQGGLPLAQQRTDHLPARPP